MLRLDAAFVHMDIPIVGAQERFAAIRRRGRGSPSPKTWRDERHCVEKTRSRAVHRCN
jgi:hypothetical protein